MAKGETVREKKLRILVIEDSELRAEFLIDKFNRFEIRVVKDPLEGVKALRQGKYDLIFLDYDLASAPTADLIENGTGIYVAKRLRETINKLTPVVIHSMNIKAAEYMVGLMEKAVMIPFHRLREELERNEIAAFLQKLLKEK